MCTTMELRLHPHKTLDNLDPQVAQAERWNLNCAQVDNLALSMCWNRQQVHCQDMG